jgi:raffinose/stachyose/melibiose transport system substrate-binding protein
MVEANAHGRSQVLTVKNRVYSFTAGFSPNGILYNRDLFRSLGLVVPKKFSDLLSLCQKISAAGKIPITAGMASPNAPINMLTVLMSSFVYSKDPNWTLKRNQPKVTFAGSPLWQPMMQAIVRMKDANCFQPAPAGTTFVADINNIATGQAAMIFAATTTIANIQVINPNANLAMFAFPGENANDTRMAVGTAQQHIAANRATRYPNQAKTFINFLGRPKQNILYAKVGGITSSYDFARGVLPDYLADVAALVKAEKSVFSPIAGWPRPDKGLFVPGFYTQIPGLFTGQRTPDQILQNMDALWDKP